MGHPYWRIFIIPFVPVTFLFQDASRMYVVHVRKFLVLMLMEKAVCHIGRLKSVLL